MKPISILFDADTVPIARTETGKFEALDRPVENGFVVSFVDHEPVHHVDGVTLRAGETLTLNWATEILPA